MKNIKNNSFFIVLIIILIIFSGNAYCEEPARELFANNYGKPDIDYGKIIISTVFVMVTAFSVLFIVKKLKFNHVGNQNIIDIVYNYPISSKEKLFIVKVANEYLLLSSSHSGIQKIHALDSNNIKDEISRSNNKKHEFANIFANSLGKNSNV